MRLAGMITGVFVILEMLVFQKAVKLIPQAVFSGILFKIGYDVFDFEPFSIYLKWFVERILDERRSVSDLQYHRLCSVAEPARHTHVGFVILAVLVLTSMFERHNSMSPGLPGLRAGSGCVSQVQAHSSRGLLACSSGCR